MTLNIIYTSRQQAADLGRIPKRQEQRRAMIKQLPARGLDFVFG